MESFKDKVAFVTGAARGQGRSHAVNMARLGADIVLLDICKQIDSVQGPMSTREDLATTVELVEREGRSALAIEADVRSTDEMESAVGRTMERFRRIDFVVANAGILATTGEQAHHMDAWHSSIETMLSGVYFTLNATVPPMIEAGRGGSIVITCSTSGLRGTAYKLEMLNPGQIGYAAAKHGILGIMRNFAMALGSHNIRVNTVNPMAVKTPMIGNEYFSNTISDAPPGWMANVMGVGAVEPQDISEAVIWLLSDAARYVTGSSLSVDSGLMLL